MKAYFIAWCDGLKCADLTADVSDDEQLVANVSYSARTDEVEKCLCILSVAIIKKGADFKKCIFSHFKVPNLESVFQVVQ